MPRMPEAEVDIDLDLVARLLREQHPDLAGRPMRIAQNGWDNVMVRLGDDLAVRLPRREAAARLVEHEQLVLPRLALPIAVPVPVRVGRPTGFYPWAWSVVPWLEGEVAAARPAHERDAWAGQLAEVMAALHAPADADAPANPVRGVPLADRAGAVHERLALLDDALPRPLVERLRAALASGLAAAERDGAPLWIHGDPHPLNMLCRDGALVALIDFGDVTAGDPATDLAAGWLCFTAVGRSAFIDRYTVLTGTDAATWRRARAWAAVMASALLVASDDHPALAALGRHTAAQLAADAPGL